MPGPDDDPPLARQIESGPYRTPPDPDELDVRIIVDGLAYPRHLPWLEGSY